MQIHRDPRHDRAITLADGRVLGFAEYGSPAGVPVMYFTGGNNSRLEAALLDSAALELDARIIATDRPGFGTSTFQPGRSLLDWPDDVRELADSLGLERFHVLGYSGGGPHALATGHRLANRVLGTAIVAGAAPPHTPGTRKGMWPPIRVLYALARWAPLPVLASIQKAMTDPSRNFTDANIRRMRPADSDTLSTRPEALAAITASMNEAHRAGYEGAAWEWRLYTRPWGFSLDSVPGHIELWYGEQDGNAPPAMGRYLANALPDARLTEVEDEAHLSLMIRRGGDILRRLVEG